MSKPAKFMPADRKSRAKELQIQMASTIIDALRRRGASGRLGKQFGDKRDMYNVLGYLRTPTVEDYWQMYLRQDIAKRIIDAPPNATWRRSPTIQENANPDADTPFEIAFDKLQNQLKLWSYLSRVDRLAGIGYYGVMLIGLPGDLINPVTPGSLKGPQDVMFLSVFSQRHAIVRDFVDDAQNPEYGRALRYEINLTGDLAGGLQRQPNARPKKNSMSSIDQMVDATRVLHVAEGLTEDEVHGTPRLEPVCNRLFDVEKVAGGSAEMYWRSAYGGFALEVADAASSQFAAAGQIDEAIVDDFAHGMRRWIDLEGYKLHEIQGHDVRPQEVFNVLVDLISSATGMPARILKGSERGELASSQDEVNWNKVIGDRQQNYATPVIRAFIDRMISFGALPEPASGDYEVIWPDLFEPTTADKADVFLKYAQGIAAVAPPGAPELLMTPAEIRTRFLDLESEPESDPDPESDTDASEPVCAPAPVPLVPHAVAIAEASTRTRDPRPPTTASIRAREKKSPPARAPCGAQEPGGACQLVFAVAAVGAIGATCVVAGTVPLISSLALGPLVPRALRVASAWASLAAFFSTGIGAGALWGVNPKSASVWLALPNITARISR